MKYLQLGKQLHKGNIFSKFKNLLCVYILPGIMFMHTLWARRPWPTEARRGHRITYGITYGRELHVGAGNQTQILCKNNIILVLSHLSSPNEEQLHDGQKRVFFIFQKGGFFPTILYTS